MYVCVGWGGWGAEEWGFGEGEKRESTAPGKTI